MADPLERKYQNAGASKAAIEHHYDVGNAFYERFLGATMAYSAGRWLEPATGDTLDDAQNRKLDWHIEVAAARTARRVLDVGCGWGSLIRRLRDHNRQAEIVGLTLSDAQAAYLRERALDRVEIMATPWQSYQSAQAFDAVISIGALEHFARPGMSSAERVHAYRDFFEFCAQHLHHDGRVSIQTIAWLDVDPGDEARFDFSDFFPESALPHVEEVLDAARGLFHLAELEGRPRDYVYTLREWIRRLRRHDTAAAGEAGGAPRYIANFSAFLGGFLNGTVSLYRMGLVRRRPTVVSPALVRA